MWLLRPSKEQDFVGTPFYLCALQTNHLLSKWGQSLISRRPKRRNSVEISQSDKIGLIDITDITSSCTLLIGSSF